MVNVTISVSPDLKSRIEKHPEMNWSEVARQAWQAKIEQLELLNKLTAKSKATDEDILELSRRIKAGMARWHESQKA